MIARQKSLMCCQGAVVNGYDRYGGLEFSRETRSQADHDSAVAAAWQTPHVVRVVTEWPFKGVAVHG